MFTNLLNHRGLGPWPPRFRALAAALCIVGLNAAAHAQEEDATFRETFGDTALGAPWTTALAPEARIEVKDGWATFFAPEGRIAHATRPAGADGISVSGRMARWAGVYLVWGPDNWCGVGKISPTPFGRFFSIAMVDGKPSMAVHRGTDFNGAHFVRARLGTDHVAFQYQLDGRWTDLRKIERPKAFAGAPRFVAVGKAYGPKDRPFETTAGAAEKAGAATVEEASAHASANANVPSGAIDEARVEMVPEAELALNAAELRALRHPPAEPVGALLEQSADDPTYEQIVGLYPPFRSPREAVGVPEHQSEIGVDWLGRLDASPWAPPKAWFLIGDPPVPFGQPGAAFRRRLLNGHLPMVALERRIDGVDHELTVFGWSEGFRVDRDTFAYARFSSRSAGAAPLPKQVALAWGQGEGQRHVFPLKPKDGRAEVFLRFKWPEPSTVETLGAEAYHAKFRETAARWRARLAPAERFDVPDARVMEAYRAWIGYAMINADTIDGWLEPHDGGGFYDQMYGQSVALHAIAMDQYGLHDYAARILATQRHFQRPDGLYVQDCGLVDAGGFLAALAKHHALTGDRDWLKQAAPNMVRQGDWIVRQRRAAPKEGTLRGLIKFRPYNDHPAPVYNYFGNAWCARGLALAAEALEAIHAPEAAGFAAEAKRYRQDVLDSMKAAAFVHDGATLLPMEPDTHRLLNMSLNRGGGYWGLIASPLLETGLLAPDDPRTNWIVDALEKRGGLIAGVCEFQDGIDHAYTFGYLDNALKRDEVRKALLGFWSFLAFGMTRDTYSPVEVSMIATGENHFTLPHLYSCTEQLRLLRNLLVREDGAELWLGQGVPRAWLEPGKHVEVKSAPTDFGDVSYRLDADADGSIRAALDPPERSAPSRIRLRIRHPKKRPIVSVVATPATKVAHTKETIVLEGPRGPVDLRIEYSKP